MDYTVSKIGESTNLVPRDKYTNFKLVWTGLGGGQKTPAYLENK